MYRAQRRSGVLDRWYATVKVDEEWLPQGVIVVHAHGAYSFGVVLPPRLVQVRHECLKALESLGRLLGQPHRIVPGQELILFPRGHPKEVFDEQRRVRTPPYQVVMRPCNASWGLADSAGTSVNPATPFIIIRTGSDLAARNPPVEPECLLPGRRPYGVVHRAPRPWRQ